MANLPTDMELELAESHRNATRTPSPQLTPCEQLKYIKLNLPKWKLFADASRPAKPNLGVRNSTVGIGLKRYPLLSWKHSGHTFTAIFSRKCVRKEEEIETVAWNYVLQTEEDERVDKIKIALVFTEQRPRNLQYLQEVRIVIVCVVANATCLT
ncbi:hypothetical protein TNCV_3371591 [Trichonephila clavipes]|nr:hypothetical protein TNCV_3371591 [Trichonephila clavipes]